MINKDESMVQYYFLTIVFNFHESRPILRGELNMCGNNYINVIHGGYSSLDWLDTTRHISFLYITSWHVFTKVLYLSSKTTSKYENLCNVE